jgi:hypothetical protein
VSFRSQNKVEGPIGTFLKDVNEDRIARGSCLYFELLDRISRGRIHTDLQWLMDLLRSGIKIVTITDGRVCDEHSVKDPMQLIGSLLIMSQEPMRNRSAGPIWSTGPGLGGGSAQACGR